MSNIKNKDIRLNRFIAMCGICSRRKADDLIQQGIITINQNAIKTLGHKVNLKDIVCLKGVQILPEQKKYIILNKPRGYITTMRDERGRSTVMTLIQDVGKERLVPVGRLDKETTGLLLFTNDGLLAKRLTHPKYEVKKTYHATLDKELTKTDFLKITNGLELEDGFVKVDNIKHINADRRRIEIQIHVGKNRIVRRIFSFLGYVTLELDRVAYSFLTQENLPVGSWRELNPEELKILNQDN